MEAITPISHAEKCVYYFYHMNNGAYSWIQEASECRLLAICVDAPPVRALRKSTDTCMVRYNWT